ncbi:hypothetical protein HK104_000833, partial [Borealophlyctis nickersoniae]
MVPSTCIACTEPTLTIHHLPCGHAYCTVCLSRHLRTFLATSTVAKCCGKYVPVPLARVALTADEFVQFQRIGDVMGLGGDGTVVSNSEKEMDALFAQLVRAMGWKACPSG